MTHERQSPALHLVRAAAFALPLLAAGSSLADPQLPFYAMPVKQAPDILRPNIPASPNPLLNYHGGAVISNVVVVQVNWTSAANQQVQSQMQSWFGSVLQSEYMDWLGSQYDTAGRGGNQHIGRGTFDSSHTITPSNGSAQISETDIGQELVSQLQAGKLPAPQFDAHGHSNTLYFFEFPPSVSLNLQGSYSSCQYFLGYHFTTTYQGKNVAFAAIPDCQQGWSEMQIVHAHELIEAVTDADVGVNDVAWNSDSQGGQEIGDLCNGKTGTVGGVAVQLEYSNQDGNCVVASAYRQPICTPQVSPPNCRLCTSADNGKGCAGDTAICDAAPKDAKYGQCVQCAANTDCSAGTPICDSSSRTCRACSADADCSAPGPACATSGSSAGKCVQCTADSQCSGATPACDASSNTCVASQGGGGGGGGGGGSGADGGTGGRANNNSNSGGGTGTDSSSNPFGDGGGASGCRSVTAGRGGDDGVLALVAALVGSMFARRRRAPAPHSRRSATR